MPEVRDPDAIAARVAAAIGEPARTRMLYALMDGHARTSTELALVADVSPSTASSHLNRLLEEQLVAVTAQGKCRYYRLHGPPVARLLESLNVLAGSRSGFVPTTPHELRAARTCYDHMAGTTAVRLHDRVMELGWLRGATGADDGYDVTKLGREALQSLGIDLAAVRALRRRFAYGCLDWSERRPHIGGALGAALLELALRRRWVTRDVDSRALSVTRAGQRELHRRFGIESSFTAS